MGLLYIDKIPERERVTFSERLHNVCERLEIRNPNIMMQLFWTESGLNPAAENRKFPFSNPSGYATGLIQFVPKTAIGLGTSTWELKTMRGFVQLEYVYKYFRPYAGRIKSYYDLYLITFMPALFDVGMDDGYVFKSGNLSASSIATSNPVIDGNKDKKISYAEFKRYVYKSVAPVNRLAVFGDSSLVGGVGLLGVPLLGMEGVRPYWLPIVLIAMFMLSVFFRFKKRS